MMTTMPLCVSTGILPGNIVLSVLESFRHEVWTITVRLMGNMTILTNVDGLVIVLTEISVITERLHANLLTLINIVAGYASPMHLSFDGLKNVGSCWHTMFRLQCSYKWVE